MLDSASQLSVSNLVICAILTIPIVYNLFRHGKYGILGWGYLLAFCVLRMTGAGLQLSNPANSTAGVIGGVGLSPLVLAYLGIMHESSLYISGSRPWPLGTVLYILLHLAVGGAVGLLVAGNTSSAGLTSGPSRVGAILFLSIWTIIVGLCIMSSRYPKDNDQARKLLLGVSLLLVFLGVRIIYSVVGTFIVSINPYTGLIGYRIGLEALMEYFASIGLTMIGLITRNIQKKKTDSIHSGLPLQQRPLAPMTPAEK